MPRTCNNSSSNNSWRPTTATTFLESWRWRWRRRRRQQQHRLRQQQHEHVGPPHTTTTTCVSESYALHSSLSLSSLSLSLSLSLGAYLLFAIFSSSEHQLQRPTSIPGKRRGGVLTLAVKEDCGRILDSPLHRDAPRASLQMDGQMLIGEL